MAFSYVRRQGSVLALTMLAATTTFLAFSVLTFLPLFARGVFHEGIGGYTRLMAFSGAGSVVGALAVAWLGQYKRMGLTVLIVQGLCGLLMVAFASSRVLWLSDILLFFTGAALIVVFSTVTSLVQLIAPNELRWRLLFPVQSESLPVAADHSFGLNYHQCGLPTSPETREPNPHKSV